MKKTLSRYGRKTIAVLYATLNDQYGFALYQGIKKASLKRNFNLLNVVSGSMDSRYAFKYEYENNQLYYLLTEKSIDGLILMPSSIYNYSTKERLAEVLSLFPAVPLVTVSVPLEGHPGIFVDNIIGIRSMVRHMHREHNKTRIAFISACKQQGIGRPSSGIYRRTCRLRSCL